MSEIVANSSNEVALRGVGNKQGPPLAHWFLTWNNYTEDNIVAIVAMISEKCSRWAFQEEVGHNSGTKHLQGAFTFKNKIRGSSLIKKFPGSYWEKCQSAAAMEYCQKSDTRCGRQWIYPEPIVIPVMWQTWQHDIVKMLDEKPDDRTIYWYWSHNGGVGKSSLAKFLIHKYKNRIAYTTNLKGADLVTSISEETTIVLMDLARDAKAYECFPFTAIEGIKNGIITDGKLKKTSRTFLINHPWVIVFANERPDNRKFSADRFIVVNVDN
jgi:hypothetical protein